MLSEVVACSLSGMEGRLVRVQVDVSAGLPSFTIVGLPDLSLQEARERVRAAIRNTGLEWPARRITVNLAPAELRKEGPGFDLAIAVAVMTAIAGRRLPPRPRRAFLGQLSLDGRVTHVDGVLPAVLALVDAGIDEVYVAPDDLAEAGLVPGVALHGVADLAALHDHLSGGQPIARHQPGPPTAAPERSVMDLAQVAGQPAARRALEVAAAGGHNLLLIGPPGSGKTLLARCLPGILPPLELREAFEATQVHSVRGLLQRDTPLLRQRPFRAPHHSISRAGMIGGGSGLPRPGEVSLAHRGVLFLDELPEFSRDVLESLRQPLEEGFCTVNRVGQAVTFPSSFQLIAACNPCPCGHYGVTGASCRCSDADVGAYNRRLSGPLRDRIDIVLNVPRVDLRTLNRRGRGEPEPTAAVRERVMAARDRQGRRLGPGVSNALISVEQIEERCRLSRAATETLVAAGRSLGVSARGYHRLMRLARTIADLEGAEATGDDHVLEALAYRDGREAA